IDHGRQLPARDREVLERRLLLAGAERELDVEADASDRLGDLDRGDAERAQPGDDRRLARGLEPALDELPGTVATAVRVGLLRVHSPPPKPAAERCTSRRNSSTSCAFSSAAAYPTTQVFTSSARLWSIVRIPCARPACRAERTW